MRITAAQPYIPSGGGSSWAGKNPESDAARARTKPSKERAGRHRASTTGSFLLNNRFRALGETGFLASVPPDFLRRSRTRMIAGILQKSEYLISSSEEPRFSVKTRFPTSVETGFPVEPGKKSIKKSASASMRPLIEAPFGLVYQRKGIV